MPDILPWPLSGARPGQGPVRRSGEFSNVRFGAFYSAINNQVRRMKDLERENAQLKKLVADLALDKAILQEASKLTF